MRERKLYNKKKGDPRECDPDRLAAIANDQALRDAGIDPDVLACLYMLSPQRAEEYNTWLGVGFTLKACGLQYEPLWHDWSRLSDKYDPAVASSKWASFPSDSQPAPKDWLRRAARSDSPDAYAIFAKSSTEDAIFQSVLKSQDESGTRLPRSSESEVQRALNLKYSEGEESGRCCGEPSSGTTGTPMIAEVPPRVSSICAMKWANILRHTAWFVGVTKASPRGAEC